MTLKEQLIAEASAYCDRRGISLGRLAVLVVNDGKFFKRLEGGGDCTTTVYERFQDFFRQHEPGGGLTGGQAQSKG